MASSSNQQIDKPLTPTCEHLSDLIFKSKMSCYKPLVPIIYARALLSLDIIMIMLWLVYNSLILDVN